MPLISPASAAEAKSRLVLVSFTSLSLRLMENWRQLVRDVSGQFPDFEKTMILGAIITISGEKLTRIKLESKFHSLSDPFPMDLLTKCNISSVAAAVGLNRETVRRKVLELIKDELVARDAAGALHIGPGLLQRIEVRDTLQAQVELLRRIANQLLKLDVLQFGAR